MTACEGTVAKPYYAVAPTAPSGARGRLMGIGIGLLAFITARRSLGFTCPASVWIATLRRV